MITGGKKWHYVTVKSLSALLKGIASKHKADFYFLNCFHPYRKEKKLKKYEKVSNNHDSCYTEMHDECNKILKYIYVDLQCLLEKMHSCQNNHERSYTEKKTKHTSCGYSLFINCLFHSAKNKLDCYGGKDCMEKFCKGLREHAMRIFNYEKKRNNTANRLRN